MDPDAGEAGHAGDPEQPEVGAAVEPENRSGTRVLHGVDVAKASLDAYYMELGRLVGFDQVQFDEQRGHGQVRALNPKGVAAKLASMRARPPKEPLKLTLWPTSVQSMPVSARPRAHFFFPVPQ
jgi:hypothetical protein